MVWQSLETGLLNSLFGILMSYLNGVSFLLFFRCTRFGEEVSVMFVEEIRQSPFKLPFGNL